MPSYQELGMRAMLEMIDKLTPLQRDLYHSMVRSGSSLEDQVLWLLTTTGGPSSSTINEAAQKLHEDDKKQ